jgi:trehalose-6-phosphate synthase
MNRLGREIYFMNYKNSVHGTGGVGTVSRDMQVLYPDVHFVFWDGSLANRANDISINISEKIHKKIHTTHAKSYLWPLLHGINPKARTKELHAARKQLEYVSDVIIDEVIGHSRTINQDNVKVYWINDYTAMSLTSKLREKDQDAVIVFTFRTPFGVNGKYPNFSHEDNDLLRGLLAADLITFHRTSDMKLFATYINDHFSGDITTAKCHKLSSKVILKNKHALRLAVVAMGNNRKYRKKLMITPKTTRFYQQIRSTVPKEACLISGISRFEESKGIEYEIDLIARTLEEYPELIEKFVFRRFSYLSPNKQKDENYARLLKRLNRKIVDINEKYSRNGWMPIKHDFNKKLDDNEVAGFLAASDILIIASMADGFNHLALEAILSQKRYGIIQLLLSDIGITDYIVGYKKISYNLDKDAKTLHSAIRQNKVKSVFRQLLLRQSSRKLSSERWMRKILSMSDKIQKEKS